MNRSRMAKHAFVIVFVCVSADLNGLKAANDNLGHAAGDELIKGAADCLKECFGAYGSVYRVGGDEFAALLNLSGEQLRQALDNLVVLTGAWHGEQVKELSIACGCAAAAEFPSADLDELIRTADERMYKAKAEHYQTTGRDRRK